MPSSRARRRHRNGSLRSETAAFRLRPWSRRVTSEEVRHLRNVHPWDELPWLGCRKRRHRCRVMRLRMIGRGYKGTGVHLDRRTSGTPPAEFHQIVPPDLTAPRNWRRKKGAHQLPHGPAALVEYRAGGTRPPARRGDRGRSNPIRERRRRYSCLPSSVHPIQRLMNQGPHASAATLATFAGPDSR